MLIRFRETTFKLTLFCYSLLTRFCRILQPFDANVFTVHTTVLRFHKQYDQSLVTTISYPSNILQNNIPFKCYITPTGLESFSHV